MGCNICKMHNDQYPIEIEVIDSNINGTEQDHTSIMRRKMKFPDIKVKQEMQPNYNFSPTHNRISSFS